MVLEEEKEATAEAGDAIKHVENVEAVPEENRKKLDNGADSAAASGL